MSPHIKTKHIIPFHMFEDASAALASALSKVLSFGVLGFLDVVVFESLLPFHHTCFDPHTPTVQLLIIGSAHMDKKPNPFLEFPLLHPI
jgi:hypothetical protein